jgi:beta-galactosidase
MHWESPAMPLRIDIAGVSELKLVVEDAGDGNVWDHADWANAVISDGLTAPVRLE